MSALDTSVSVVVLFVRGTPDHLKLVVAKSCDELLEGVCLPNIELPRPHGRVLEGLFSSQLFIQLVNNYSVYESSYLSAGVPLGW